MHCCYAVNKRLLIYAIIASSIVNATQSGRRTMPCGCRKIGKLPASRNIGVRVCLFVDDMVDDGNAPPEWLTGGWKAKSLDISGILHMQR